MHKTKKNNLGTWYITYIASSACSRDSRPRDWSRLGAIFKVSISPNISRDSRDWGQHYISVFYPFSKVCFFLKFTYFEKATKFCEIFTLLLSYAVPVKSKVKILQNWPSQNIWTWGSRPHFCIFTKWQFISTWKSIKILMFLK